MCSMALVHSRIERVFFVQNLEAGGLTSRYTKIGRSQVFEPSFYCISILEGINVFH